MDFYKTSLYSLLCKKLSFDTLRKAEEVHTLGTVKYYLENDHVGYAIHSYEFWQNAFPDGVDCEQSPITLQEVCRLRVEDFDEMPWIYASALQTLCADKEPREDGEITAETQLDYLAERSYASSNWELPPNLPRSEAFEYTYKNFMKQKWVVEFVERLRAPWPLTSGWSSEEERAEMTGETIWPAEFGYNAGYIVVKPKDIPPIPPSPKLESKEDSSYSLASASDMHLADQPVSDPPVSDPPVSDPPVSDKPKGPPKVRDAEPYWPFMRCKNVYNAYNTHSRPKRLSHHDLLISLADMFKMSVEELKKTNPYTIKGIKGLSPRGYY